MKYICNSRIEAKYKNILIGCVKLMILTNDFLSRKWLIFSLQTYHIEKPISHYYLIIILIQRLLRLSIN